MVTPKPAAAQPKAPTPQAVAANKKVMVFSFLMLATLLASLLSLPLRLVTIPVAIVAAVFGFLALRACWAAKIRGSLIVFTIIAMVLTIAMGAGTALTLARWDIEMGYQDCKNQAITNSAKLNCTSTYNQDMQDYLEGLLK